MCLIPTPNLLIHTQGNSTMKNINERKATTANAFALLKVGGTAVAQDFTQVVTDFWLVDKRNTHMLTNWLEQAKRFPRIAAAARKLMPQHCGVKVEKTKGGKFEITNLELSKKAKAKCMAECRKLAALELTSLLNHPNIKVTVEKVWNKETEVMRFKKQINTMIENGISGNELLAMIQVAVDADIKAKKDNKKVVDIKPETKPTVLVGDFIPANETTVAQGLRLATV